ncbi:cyclin N-terminal domain-containing protein 2 [Megalops cyprinoides]|uniref:cyclin N-terminal domain-containing protein 2 n=1 Tax=Megalops cyprinoides TaxID=118141 RepID=UPI001865076F|nr:cyclin N-terminal domain-containing protein 2 [Megalops cyprinoides]
MAQTGFCDSRPLLDLHKKTEERRAPLRTRANACVPKERRLLADAEEPRGGHCTARPEHRWVRKLPASEDGVIEDYAEQNGSARTGGREEEALLLRLHGLHGLTRLGTAVPGLLMRELEAAMCTLGLIYDKTYAWDIFSGMMRCQSHYTFPNAELPRPFTDATRAILVDWVTQVHKVFNFSEETLYLAVHLLNRALRQIKVQTSNLQLLSAVCLFLAGKKEECVLPEISELCFLMDNCYSKRKLLHMEQRVLCDLNFDISYCPPLHFLLLTARIARCSDKVVWMARYLLELSLLEGQCVVFQPAQLACAALCLARKVLQEPATPEGEAAWRLATSLHVCSEATLQRIMHILAVAASRAAGRETRASFVKFATVETLQVSTHHALHSAPCLLGLSGLQGRGQKREGGDVRQP